MRECVFCDVAAGRIKAARLWESDDVVAFLDCDPIREGHALIVPRAHIEDYVDLPPRVSTQISDRRTATWAAKEGPVRR